MEQKIIKQTSLKIGLEFMEAADLIGRSDLALVIGESPRKVTIVQEGDAEIEDINLALATLKNTNKRNPSF